MTSHVYDRAQAELDDLNERLGKLESFLVTGGDEKFPTACRSLLASQRDAMRIYARVLDERIDQFLKYE